jgi:hypothetical protein
MPPGIVHHGFFSHTTAEPEADLESTAQDAKSAADEIESAAAENKTAAGDLQMNVADSTTSDGDSSAAALPGNIDINSKRGKQY